MTPLVKAPDQGRCTAVLTHFRTYSQITFMLQFDGHVTRCTAAQDGFATLRGEALHFPNFTQFTGTDTNDCNADCNHESQ